ncbi:hypothetical protein HETIRDRAFT_168180 [Heterobasidion irregulare TC 32-1]|uniref:Uncharacterized protein n=1 Tax=Heterobasidion irregulare (strain TC 32-1) TaxID=747525 RepID=W4KKL6_HETIT|nr:uncharacterized protein HETIRDRAFT_168180 [Heterobasidion irregulare TC 32-1]ETW85611.1 hypothetical protein HETIRDRAFT_168180 [Heterobasidion irregulare TC 32-1]
MRPRHRGLPNKWLFSIIWRVGRTCPNSQPRLPRLTVALIMLPLMTGLPRGRASCCSI